jgi:hypothetical protein
MFKACKSVVKRAKTAVPARGAIERHPKIASCHLLYFDQSVFFEYLKPAV